MDEAFIIMQIGNPQMDTVCDEVLVPAIEAAGLVARRVDRDNLGELLKVEIVDFIQRAQVIVADLTNERPNCYLEVGYAMGLGKKSNLILTAREDHHHRSANYRLDGHRVHFDLEGYDLLLWDPTNLNGFRTELETRIKRRLAVVRPAPAAEPGTVPQPITPVFDNSWIAEQHTAAVNGLATIGRDGYVEATVALNRKGSWRQPLLLSTVEQSQVHTFGWPIGIVLNRDEYRPRATPDGVRAEVAIQADDTSLSRSSYDFWYLRQTGDFYMLQSLFEDERADHVLFFDTRVIRTTELLLFLSRCYSRLELPDDTVVSVRLTHGGLTGRTLRAASPSRLMTHERSTNENQATSQIQCTVGELQSKLKELVLELVSPLFMLFDFFEPSETVIADLVGNLVEGRVI